MEQWKDILNFEGYYQVSTTGKIRSLDTTDKWGRLRKGKILTPQEDSNGYLRVRISVNSKKYTLKIHRIVAQAFIDNTFGKQQVNHIDGNKSNNNTSNLEWCTNSENQTHAIKTGLKIPKTGANAAKFKSPIKVYDLNNTYLYSLNGNKELAEHGFDYRLVSAVILGKRNHHKQHIFSR